MNSAAKIVAVILTLFMLAYVGYQSYQVLYNPYETEIVVKEQYLEDLEMEGFFVREEAALQESKRGVIGYPYRNAEKVSRGAVVANIYQSEEELYRLEEVQELSQLKEILSQAQDATQLQGVKLDLLVKQIAQSKAELVASVDAKDFTNIKSQYLTLMSRMDQFNVYIDPAVSYEGTIASLDAQIAALSGTASQSNETIVSPDSGYFSNTADGYESVFTPQVLNGLTVEKAQQLLSQKGTVSADSVGKITKDANWSFVAVITAKQAESFHEGDKVTLRFHAAAAGETEVTVSQVITEAGNEKAVVVFTGNILNEDFISMRFERPTVVVKDYTGIIVPKEAVRVRQETDEEGNTVEVKGVYVMVGTEVQFRKLDPLYEDDHVVVSRIVTNSDYVAIYDQVIIKGKDLYNAV